jgi:prepilin-type processing-associated H-X9-DG protein
VNVGGTIPIDFRPNKNAYKQVGLFRNLTLTTAVGQNGNVKQISTTDVRSADRRPMIAESGYNADYTATNRQWVDTGTTVATGATARRFGFLWPDTAVPVVRSGSSGALMPIHSGVVNVTFCDGHTEQMSDDPDTTCDKYDYGPLSTYP